MKLLGLYAFAAAEVTARRVSAERVQIRSLVDGAEAAHATAHTTADRITALSLRVEAQVGTPAIVTIGQSLDSSRKCVHAAGPVSCAANAGDRGVRVNADHREAGDSFEITASGTEVCARRADADAPWGLNLQVSCMEDDESARTEDAGEWWPYSSTADVEADEQVGLFSWWRGGQAETRSPFEIYRDESSDHCKPQVHRSTCAPENYKGMVVFFHGFAACGEQVNDLAPRFTAECMDVVAPTAPGMGGRVMECWRGEECTVRIGDWPHQRGFDLRELPTHAQGYRRYVRQINYLIRDERNFRARQMGIDVDDMEVAVMGLSLGGPMAVYAVHCWRGLYTKMLLLNPYFGVGPDMNEELLQCEREASTREDRLECRHQLVLSWFSPMGMTESNPILDYLADTRGDMERFMQTNLVKLSDVFGHMEINHIDIPPIRGIMDATQIWDTCPKIFSGENKGICAFKQGHLLATHSFAMHVLLEAKNANVNRFPTTQAITTQSDGRTRNGLTYSLLRHLDGGLIWGPETSMCMYRGGAMPHANLEEPSGWWVEKLFGQISSFLARSNVKSVSDGGEYSGDRAQCQDLPLGGLSLWTDAAAMHELVLPEAAPVWATELWPGALWQLLRAADNVADAFVGH